MALKARRSSADGHLVAAARRQGGVLLSLLVCLLVVIAVGGALFGPAIATAIVRGGGIVALGKRKFAALHDFALFRSKGDKAVVRWGEPSGKSRSKRPPAN